MRSIVAATCWAKSNRFGSPVTLSVPGSVGVIAGSTTFSAGRSVDSRLGSVYPSIILGGLHDEAPSAVGSRYRSTGWTGVGGFGARRWVFDADTASVVGWSDDEGIMARSVRNAT